jgi:hypothetical protein
VPSVNVVVHGHNSQLKKDCGGNITLTMSGTISSCILTNLSSATFPLIQAISQNCWDVFWLHKWRLEEKSPDTDGALQLHPSDDWSENLPTFIAFTPQRGRHEC